MTRWINIRHTVYLLSSSSSWSSSWPSSLSTALLLSWSSSSSSFRLLLWLIVFFLIVFFFVDNKRLLKEGDMENSEYETHLIVLQRWLDKTYRFQQGSDTGKGKRLVSDRLRMNRVSQRKKKEEESPANRPGNDDELYDINARWRRVVAPPPQQAGKRDPRHMPDETRTNWKWIESKHTGEYHSSTSSVSVKDNWIPLAYLSAG